MSRSKCFEWRSADQIMLHDVGEIADRLGVSDKTVRRLIKSGKLKFYRVGRQIRISEEQLKNYLTEHGTDPE
jgi:putative molybdopterin biosynthesis protein